MGEGAGERGRGGEEGRRSTGTKRGSFGYSA